MLNIKSRQTYSWTSPAQSKLREPFGVARAACFEELAGVFASSGALHYAKIFASLKTKMYTSYIIEQRPERLYFPFERIFESISRMIVKVGFNGKSRMLCLSIGTAVYMDMTACRPEKSLRKHFFVLHLSNFSQVKNMQNLYLPDN